MRLEETGGYWNRRTQDDVHSKERRRQRDGKDEQKRCERGYETLSNERHEVWKGQRLMTGCENRS